MQLRHVGICTAALAGCLLAFAGTVDARPLNTPGQVFVPGRYEWNARQRQYVWVPSHWERNARGRQSAGVGWTFSNGRWQFAPGR